MILQLILSNVIMGNPEQFILIIFLPSSTARHMSTHNLTSRTLSVSPRNIFPEWRGVGEIHCHKWQPPGCSNVLLAPWRMSGMSIHQTLQSLLQRRNYSSVWNSTLPRSQFERLLNHIRRNSGQTINDLLLLHALKLRPHQSTQAASFALDNFTAYLTVQFLLRCRCLNAKHMWSHIICA